MNEIKKPEFQIIYGKSRKLKYPRLNPQQLNDICLFPPTFEEKVSLKLKLEKLTNRNSNKVLPILESLLWRNLSEELPVEEETFLYQRNFQECRKLKHSVGKLLSSKNYQANSPFWNDFVALLALEKRKLEWLEDKIYPILYSTALEVARGEVNQFLIKYKNSEKLEEFRNLRETQVSFKDELSYLLEGNPSSSKGVISGNNISIRVPQKYNIGHEWKIFLTLVHESIHFISTEREVRRVEGLAALDEAITQIVTYLIAIEYLEKGKTPLRGAYRPSLYSMGYSEYIIVVYQLLSKIPLSYFVAAMLNSQDWEVLREKFQEEFGSEDSLAKYGENLQNLYPEHPLFWDRETRTRHPRQRRLVSPDELDLTARIKKAMVKQKMGLPNVICECILFLWFSGWMILLFLLFLLMEWIFSFLY